MASMYRMAPVCAWSGPVAAPGGMYRLADVHAAGAQPGPAPPLELRAARLAQKPSSDMKMLENRQILLLQQLENLHSRLISMKSLFKESATTPTSHAAPSPSDLPRDIVINVDPDCLPYSLLKIKKIFNMKISHHTHSSIPQLSPPAIEFAKRLTETNPPNPNIAITLIWKDVGARLELIASSLPVVLHGEVNALRYLASAIPSTLSYADSSSSSDIDSSLDICHRLQMHKTAKDRQILIKALNAKLDKQKWIAGTPNVSIADVAAYSALKQLKSQTDFTPALIGWLKKCEASNL